MKVGYITSQSVKLCLSPAVPTSFPGMSWHFNIVCWCTAVLSFRNIVYRWLWLTFHLEAHIYRTRKWRNHTYLGILRIENFSKHKFSMLIFLNMFELWEEISLCSENVLHIFPGKLWSTTRCFDPSKRIISEYIFSSIFPRKNPEPSDEISWCPVRRYVKNRTTRKIA